MAEATATAEPEAPASEDADQPTPEEAPEMGQALTERQGDGSILYPARYGFDEAQADAIRRTVAKDCTPPEFVMFLEVCARYQLDPFAKQIYAAKIKGAVQIIVSRDGLLAHAEKQPDFQGLYGDVICRNDVFKVAYENGQRSIEHSYEWGIGSLIEEGADAESLEGQGSRGPILGAWAEVRREGRAPTFFVARMDEYERSGDTPWAKHKSAMILKVAEVYALRKAYSISGVVGEDEMDQSRREALNITSVPDADFGDDEDEVLAIELRALVEQANQLVGGSYRPAKVRAKMTDHNSRVAFRDELQQFVAEHAEEEPVEAVVVDDEPETDHEQEG